LTSLANSAELPSSLLSLFGKEPDNMTQALLDALPIGVYICDASGRLLQYNRAACGLWGRRPEPGSAGPLFCGSYRLYSLEGVHIPHASCPMAWVLANGRALRDQEIIIERPDGSRIVALVSIEPLRDADGETVGAVNVFRDNSERSRHCLGPGEHDNTQDANQRTETQLDALRLAAIVEWSDDAILAKSLDGTIWSWNRGAERLFGYSAAEAIGQSVTMLIPEDRQDEEEAILSRIRKGLPVEHYETIRQRKDGSLVNISLTVSPIKTADGTIVGASKIARDITERVRANEQQKLLLQEMNHRIKNIIALCSGLVSLSARSANTPEDLARSVQERLLALARAHELILPHTGEADDSAGPATTLYNLIGMIVSPHDHATADAPSRIVIRGVDVPISGRAATSLALLFHEFATNAAKYGALSTTEGVVEISCANDGEQFAIEWRESGGPSAGTGGDGEPGFGDRLARATVQGQLRGELSRLWDSDGLVIRLSVPLERLNS
jgi:PAS domain S-box-containing protein